MNEKSKTTVVKTNTSTTNLIQDVAKTIRHFKKYTSFIKRLLDETNKSYDEIKQKRVLPSGKNLYSRTEKKLKEIEITQSDREFIESLKSRPIALVICSQTYNGKARFVNELLNEPLLPESPTVKKDDIVRMIRIKHHPTTGASLNVSGSFELVGTDGVQKALSWSTVPYEEILVQDNPSVSSSDFIEDIETASLEIRKPLDILGKDLQILLTPTNQQLDIKQIYSQITENIVPIFIYVIDQDKLNENDIEELKSFRTILPNVSLLFIRFDPNNLTNHSVSNSEESAGVRIFKQLCDLNYLSFLPGEPSENSTDANSLFQSDMIDNVLANFSLFVNYIRKYTDRLNIRAVSHVQRSHELCLDLFNDSAFEMARDILITPKRINYAREKEKELYDSLLSLTNSKQNEIQRLISQAIESMYEIITDQACSLDITGIVLTDDLTVTTAKDLKRCTSTIQEFVLSRLNQAIADQLSSSVHILRQDYVGTLTRCLETLELVKDDDDDDDESSSSASKALQEILQSAYQVNITMPAHSNMFKLLIDRMKEFFRTFSWTNCPRIDPDFKRSVAVNMLNSLSESRLAKSVCAQLNDRIRMSHDNFETLLKQLEHRHSDRLKSTEDKQQRVRKEFTPKIARHLLDSTSLKDLIRYGLPKSGREVGRGQYGVVYECESWANQRSCVLKSVIPPDDRHWNDLALEFHYLRRIPDHPRIVKLIGSVIDYSYLDQTPVLLVMERLSRDLYTALRNKLLFHLRIRIALDVVEGLRYLHGLGLVHRDIKLKNVLLDETNHARITDLGFCKPEVMMSGSLVGTPIHMAPELFTSKYDHTVDIYAFGILFWYICSNGVKLPNNFDVCSSKDVLWSKVKHGVRPERLNDFTDECWEMMNRCWDPNPSLRPYLGEVQDKLEEIFNKTISSSSS